MEHPLLGEEHKDLRRRVFHFMKEAFMVPRQSNIVFVCGGNDATHMRTLFKQYADAQLAGYEIFQPEFAMESLFSSGFPEQFDITDFESLIGSLSQAIVIFPEGPGSFAETGYFAANDELCKKIILVLDADRQLKDSFISLGPARKIGTATFFHPNIQMSYAAPNFELVGERIRRIRLNSYKKALHWKLLSDLSDFEWFCLVHGVVTILNIATMEDLKFAFLALSDAHLSVSKLHQITSILVGSGFLLEYGSFGHFRGNPAKGLLLEVMVGRVSEYNNIKLELANICLDDHDFSQLLGGL